MSRSPSTWRPTIRCAAGEFAFAPLSPSVMGIVAAGGLVEYVKRKLAAEASATAAAGESVRGMMNFRSHRLPLAVAHLGYDMLPRHRSGAGAAIGARMMLVKDNSVLLVYHSYINNWHFPGWGDEAGRDRCSKRPAARHTRRQGRSWTGPAPRLLGLYTGLTPAGAATIRPSLPARGLLRCRRRPTAGRLSGAPFCPRRSAGQHHAVVTGRSPARLPAGPGPRAGVVGDR